MRVRACIMWSIGVTFAHRPHVRILRLTFHLLYNGEFFGRLSCIGYLSGIVIKSPESLFPV